MSSAEKIICGTCKKCHRSSADNTNQSGGFLQKEKIHPIADPYRPGMGWILKLWHTGSVLALSVIATRCQLPQSGSPWQSTQSSSLCQGLSLWERWMRPEGADGEGEPAGNFMKLRSHSAPASCRGGSADRSTANGTPSPDTSPSRCSAARRRSTARPDSRSPPGTPTWTRCSRSW